MIVFHFKRASDRPMANAAYTVGRIGLDRIMGLTNPIPTRTYTTMTVCVDHLVRI